MRHWDDPNTSWDYEVLVHGASKLIFAKKALKPQQQVWAIRFVLDHEQLLRDHALSDLANYEKA